METPLIGTSESIERIRELIKYVADTDLNVLITGESGVGKEVVAHHLYYESKRKGKPFIKVNCAALPEGLLESGGPMALCARRWCRARAYLSRR